MNEKDLGKALLRGEAGIDAGALTEKVLRRDRRRMWVAGTICVAAWMLVVMMPWATILPMLARVVRYQIALNQNGGAATMPGAGGAEAREQWVEVLRAVRGGTLATFFGSIMSMFLAAVCTVSLIVVSRRATLRQVNARLGEIAVELKRIGGKGGEKT